MADVSSVQKRLRKAVEEGKFGTVWSKLKALNKKNISKDNKLKKDFDKLYKEFDSGLTAVLKKFEGAKSFDDATKYANQGMSICTDYLKKCEKFNSRYGVGGDEGEISSATSDVITALEKIKTLLEDTVRRIQELHAEEDDDDDYSAQFKALAKNGDLKKSWSKIKKTVLEMAQSDFDKEDVKSILKLYKSFDSNLTKVIKDFGKCGSIEKAKTIAEKGIGICDDYRQKVVDAEGVQGTLNITLVSSLDVLKKVFVDAVDVIKS